MTIQIMPHPAVVVVSLRRRAGGHLVLKFVPVIHIQADIGEFIFQRRDLAGLSGAGVPVVVEEGPKTVIPPLYVTPNSC